jgi:hypothetical protein
MHDIIVACLNCWDDVPILDLRDFHLTRSGVFTYLSHVDKKAAEAYTAKFKQYIGQKSVQGKARSGHDDFVQFRR